MKRPITGTAVEKMRRWAKKHARDAALPYGQALELAAREAGYASWHDLQGALKAAVPQVADELPLDPKLPPDFDQTPNETRSNAELDAWWLRPFVQSRPDGAFDVRCLDGGAWDRATYYGAARDMDEAREIAHEKLERWLKMRDRPAMLLLDGCVLLTLEPNRPGMPRPVLFAGATQDSAADFLRRWQLLGERDAATAALMVRDARGRSALVPSYAEVEAIARIVGSAFCNADGRPADFQEMALLLALYALCVPGGSEVDFTLPEMVVYLAEFGLDEGNAGDVFARVQQLRLDGAPVLLEVGSEQRHGLDHWTVRLGRNHLLKR
jgi:hypothetical protein